MRFFIFAKKCWGLLGVHHRPTPGNSTTAIFLDAFKSETLLDTAVHGWGAAGILLTIAVTMDFHSREGGGFHGGLGIGFSVT